MTTIVLADDHAAVRNQLHSLLEEEPGFHVIGEASDGFETVQTVESLHPDVLVLDLMMEGMNGIEVTRQLSESWPQTKIIIYSMYDNKAYVVEALQAGAKAYVLKGSNSTELVHAISEVTTGQIYLPESLSKYSGEVKRLINENNNSDI